MRRRWSNRTGWTSPTQKYANFACVEPYLSRPAVHPDYQEYVDNGGRLAYLGGNGFYWRIATSEALPDVVEVRRAEGGIRAWATEPGEYFHALDGGYGGLWRRNSRPPQMLCGVGFSAQGLFDGSYTGAPPSEKRRGNSQDIPSCFRRCGATVFQSAQPSS